MVLSVLGKVHFPTQIRAFRLVVGWVWFDSRCFEVMTPSAGFVNWIIEVGAWNWYNSVLVGPLPACSFHVTYHTATATRLKVPFWQNVKIAKMALLNPCMKFKFFLAKRLLLRHYESAIYKKYS